MVEFSETENKFFVVLASALIVVCIALVFFMILSKPSEKYSELYFDVASLRSNAEVGEDVDFSFSVENHEGQQVDYNYSVLIDGVEVNKGTILLYDGDEETVYETVVLLTSGEQMVEVKLDNSLQKPYTIFFWINVEESK
ncbi:MAG: DUF1616 domain-containing protein [archaeon]|jgi:uncharacterized membrane protein|nr:DUF1616 domain-containing protein [archaeon]